MWLTLSFYCFYFSLRWSESPVLVSIQISYGIYNLGYTLILFAFGLCFVWHCAGEIQVGCWEILLRESSPAQEWAVQACGGVTIPAGVQETFRCCTRGRGLVGKYWWPHDITRGIQGHVGGALGSLIWWLATLFITGGLELDDLWDSLQPKPFYELRCKSLLPEWCDFHSNDWLFQKSTVYY